MSDHPRRAWPVIPYGRVDGWLLAKREWGRANLWASPADRPGQSEGPRGMHGLLINPPGLRRRPPCTLRTHGAAAR